MHTPALQVPPAPHAIPSGGDVAEHWLIDKSQVPESHSLVAIGHPWQVAESQMSFVVIASLSSHLKDSWNCNGHRYGDMCVPLFKVYEQRT